MRNRRYRHFVARPIHRRLLSRTITAALALAVLLAGGCASSPPVDYYQLRALEVRSAAALEGAPILAVGPVTLPDYLARAQMVTRGDGTRLVVDEFNRWAEPLERAVPRVLIANLTELAPGVVAVPFSNRAVRPGLRLYTTISRFDADAQGSAALIVQWGINTAEGTAWLQPRTGRYEAQVIPADSPEALAATLSRLLQDFSRDVAAQLKLPTAPSAVD